MRTAGLGTTETTRRALQQSAIRVKRSLDSRISEGNPEIADDGKGLTVLNSALIWLLFGAIREMNFPDMCFYFPVLSFREIVPNSLKT